MLTFNKLSTVCYEEFKLSYFKSKEHFKNYINKILKANDDCLCPDDVLELDTYVKYFYGTELEKQFTWDVKNNVALLKRDNITAWLSDHEDIKVEQMFKYACSDIEYRFSEEFKDTLLGLYEVPGIYSFWVGEVVMYIGMSINLQSRILSSYSERFRSHEAPVYLKYIKTISKNDAAILEVYLIGKFAPALNSAANHGDVVTLRLMEEPAFSEPIPITVLDWKANCHE